MEITAEFHGPSQTFCTTIAGVTKQNPDGTDRQSLVKALKRGEELKLVREPANSFDKYAIAVFRTSGEQLGYLHAGDSRLASHIDSGGAVSVKVVRVRGGGGILGRFIRKFRTPYGCVIQITKGDFNWKEISPYMAESRVIEGLINSAHQIEVSDPEKAILMYREAITQIVAFDAGGSVKAAWRRARYPINRLSLLLEKQGDLQDAQEEILKYEKFHDAFGLLSADQKSVEARKQRLTKKLNR